jgi:beta-phosphoglucomutase-like phosphatase (HAD superfamily)
VLGLPDGIRGCLFDLDGVLTKTAQVHDAAWQEMFDGYLRERSRRTGEPFVPFDRAADYENFVDGKPRADGTRSFLQSRGIELPEGSPDDPPEAETVEGLSDRKNEIVLRRIREDGVAAYPGSVRYVRAARDAGLRRAVVTSSANGAPSGWSSGRPWSSRTRWPGWRLAGQAGSGSSSGWTGSARRTRWPGMVRTSW